MWARTQRFLAVLLVGSLTFVMAAPPAIGVVRVNGSFRMDKVNAWGNGTLFDGTVIETEKLPSELNVQGGTRVLLAPGSRSQVYRDHIGLEKGAAEVKGANYRVEARTLAIVPASLEATLRISLNRANHVEVAALNGPVKVMNSSGTLVANIERDTGLDLDPQVAGAAAPTKLTGILQYQKDTGKYILTDETTKVTVELRGVGLEKLVGKRVEIVGAMIPGATPVAGATQVIQVSEVRELGKGGAAAKGGAAGHAGISATTIGILAGVAAAGLGVGIYEATKSQ